MFAHSILFAVNDSLCTDEDILFYQYQYHFDIRLHLSPGRNPVKSAQNALIIDESTLASSSMSLWHCVEYLLVLYCTP